MSILDHSVLMLAAEGLKVSAIFPEHLVVQIGWILVHSTWQFALIAAIVALANLLSRNTRASIRYVYQVAAMGLLVITAAATWNLTWKSPSEEMPLALNSPRSSALNSHDGHVESEQIPGPGTGYRQYPLNIDRNLNAPVPGQQAELPSLTVRFSAALKPWLDTIVGVWFCGMAVFLCRLFWCWGEAERLSRIGTSPAEPRVNKTFERVRARLRVTQRVKVLTSTLVSSPVVVGCFRSVILLPTSFAASIPLSQLEALLAHELAHVKRYDFFVNLIQTFVETLFFYHPAVWWLSTRIRVERENCCDDLVVSSLDNRLEYGRALLAVETFRSGSSSNSGLIVGADSSDLLSRIRRLVKTGARGEPNSTGGPAAVAVVVLAAVMIATGASRWLEAAGETDKPGSRIGPFIAEITDKITLELVAVKALNGADQTVRTAAGIPIENAPDLPELTDTSNRFPIDTQTVFFRWKGVGEQYGRAYRSPGLQMYMNRDEEGFGRLLVSPKEDGPGTTIRVGLTDEAWGPWLKVDLQGKTIVETPPSLASRAVYEAIKADHVEVRKGRKVFCWSGLAAIEDRAQVEIVAVNTDGSRNDRWGTSLWDSKAGTYTADIFNDKDDRIDHFEYRLRPFRHWATFSNVSLRPGTIQSVDVTVESLPFPKEEASAESADSDATRVFGLVTDSSGTIVADASIRVFPPNADSVSTTSDEQGLFEFTLTGSQVYASMVIQSPDETSMAVARVSLTLSGDQKKRPGIDESLEVKLQPARRSVVTVIDQNGSPVPDATVVVQDSTAPIAALTTDSSGQASAVLPVNATAMIMAFKSGVGYCYFSSDVRDESNYPIRNPPEIPAALVLKLDVGEPVKIRAVDSNGNPVRNATIRPWYVNTTDNPGDTNFGSAAFNQKTDADGRTAFDWFPPTVQGGVTFWSEAPGYQADRLSILWDEFDPSREYEVVFKKMSTISGVVQDASGRPITGLKVDAKGQGPNSDQGYGQAITDDSGLFSMSVAADKAYVLHARHEGQVGYVSPVTVLEGKSVTDVLLRLEQGTTIRGNVTRGKPPLPEIGQWISLSLRLGRIPDEIDALRAEGDNFYYGVTMQHGKRTDSNGRFEFLAAPGEYVMFGPRQAEPKKFVVHGEPELEFDFHVDRKEMRNIAGLVAEKNGSPLRDATVYGVYSGATHSRSSFKGTTDVNGKFDIEIETQPATVRVLSADENLGAIFDLNASDEGRDVYLTPTYQANGRLLKNDGQPWAGAVLKYGIPVYQGESENSPFMTSFGRRVTTDADGRYTISQLVQGSKYGVDLERSKDGPWSRVATIFSDTGEEVNLGARTMQTEYGPEPLERRAASAFARTDSLTDRMELVKKESLRDYNRIAVVVANPESEEAIWLYATLRGTRADAKGLELTDKVRGEIRSRLSDFRQIWIDEEQLDELRELTADHELDDDFRSGVVLLDTDASWLCAFQPNLERPEKAIENLQLSLSTQQLPDRDAAAILSAAKTQAAIDGRKILLQETATWCGPCHVFSRFIERHRAIFDRHFIWVRIDRQRMKNADSVMRSIRPGTSRSIPWIAILNQEGIVKTVDGLLATSSRVTVEQMGEVTDAYRTFTTANVAHGENHPLVVKLKTAYEELNAKISSENFGVPGRPRDVERFLSCLSATADDMTDAEIQTLRTDLLKE